MECVDFIEKESDKVAEPFYYTIVAPTSFREHTAFNVTLSVHRNTSENADIPDAIVVRVSIEDENNEKEGAFRVFRDVQLKLDVTEIVALDIGDVPDENNYKLVVRGISGITIEREASLNIQTQKHSILIQTDKAIYKPNDKILFRVIVLDAQLKAAAINGTLNISFTDSGRNVVKKWINRNTISGVFSDSYQLSDVPALGEWRVRAEVGTQVKIVVIEVAEYVLPKFSVSIESADHFTIAGKVLHAVIAAKYTYGKPLSGKATISVSEEDNFGCFRYRRISNVDESPTDDALVRKTIDVDGTGHIEFDIEKELKYHSGERSRYYSERTFKISVDVVENLTGLSQSAEKTVKIHKSAYKVSSDLDSSCLKRDTVADITISVQKHDGSRIVFNDPSMKKMSVMIERFYADVDGSTKSEDVHELNDDGDLMFQNKIEKNESSFSLKTVYMGEETDLGMFYTTTFNIADRASLKARILTEHCVINHEVEVELTSFQPLSSYTYFIVCRSKILDSKTVAVASESDDQSPHTYNFKFLPNFNYAPRAKIIVYYMNGDQIVSTTVTAEMSADFKNFVELNVEPSVAKPGQSIELCVKSNANSIIGLLGYDQSVSLLRTGNDLARDEIWNELEMFNTQVKHRQQNYFDEPPSKMPAYYNPWDDFSNAHLILFSNTTEPIRICRKYMMACSMAMDSSAMFSVANGPAAPRIRKDFPETWIWRLIPSDKFTGSSSLVEKVPDSLTTWVLTAFSIDPINGLSITKQPSQLLVQQPFLISLNLPYAVKRGECVKIPCSIFNYTPENVEAEVIFERMIDGSFEFVDEIIGGSPELSKEQSRRRKVSIQSQEAVNVTFTIRPLIIGAVAFKVSAVSSIASDCIVKDIRVECEGVRQFVNKAVFVDLRDKDRVDGITIPIEIPRIALPDSSRINVSCIDDLLGSTARNLDQLIRLPYGCGEQNMLNFVPNIVVLNYLTNTHQLTEAMETKAKRYMEVGYQRELTYKHKDGSFSAFGESDKSGSTWLTAFVARSFRQATDHIHIDEQHIEDALKWLSKVQREDGSFVEVGSVCHKEMQSGSANGLALTAYVLTAFVVNADKTNTYQSVIDKALAHISKSFAAAKDLYAAAVTTYALHLAKHEAKDEAMKNLHSLVEQKDNLEWWQVSKKTDKYQSKTLDVEVTAYALLAQQLNGNVSAAKSLPVVKWLLNQRNDQGGFEGTQDTIIGIEALATFAVKIASKATKLVVDVKTDDPDFQRSFKVDESTNGVLQSESFPEVKTLNICAAGKGFAVVEASYSYNIAESEKISPFVLKPVATLRNEGHLDIEISTSFTSPKENETTSNMVVCEIALPSGFSVNAVSLEALKKTVSLIKRVETKNGNTVAVVYLDHLTNEMISFKIDAFRDQEVTERKPSSVIIYDYYDNALRGREFYDI